MCSTDRVPGAWYDLSARVSAARAVVSCMLEALPQGEAARPVMDNVNHSANLAAAAIDLLELCERDVERLERELKTPPCLTI